MSLTDAIKEHAYRLGFSLVGVARPNSVPHGNVFESWLGQGRHGEMAYLETPRSRQCRANPNQVLPGCRSVLVLAIRYPTPPSLSHQDLQTPLMTGKIAAYAWGYDYHHILPEKIQNLVSFIESQVGHQVSNRWYTDTGPVLERELAQRAGLGWIGKNTCLINPGGGSYLLLAEIFLEIELNPDLPFDKDRCGSCTRCITACPTGCILPDRTLDARRCISYLTIELKGPILLELRPLLGSWVFGCDVCQQVCPWNRFAVTEVDPVFGRELAPNLVEELRLSGYEFNQKYCHSPVMRSKRRGYLRNVAVALGNSHALGAVPALAQVMKQEPEPLVRAHSAWALGQIGGQQARIALEDAIVSEHDEMVRLEINDALAGNEEERI